MTNSILNRLNQPKHLVRCLLAGLTLLTITTTGTAAKKRTAPIRIAKKDPGASSASNTDLKPALKLSRASLDSLGKSSSYQATLSKKIRVGNRLTSQTMHIKLREKPFSVYLRFAKPHTGREVLYVDGKNDNHLLAHEDGLKSLAGTFSFLPTSREAMEGNRYPITKIGMKKMIEIVIKQWTTEAKAGQTEVKYYNNAKLGSVECRVIETIPKKRTSTSKFAKTRVYIEKARNLPIRVEQYGFATKKKDLKSGSLPLIEEYTYSDIKMKRDFKDIVFSTKNSNYRF
jgi:hypothetical protein